MLAGRLYWRLAVVRQRVNDEGLVPPYTMAKPWHGKARMLRTPFLAKWDVEELGGAVHGLC